MQVKAQTAASGLLKKTFHDGAPSRLLRIFHDRRNLFAIGRFEPWPRTEPFLRATPLVKGLLSPRPGSSPSFPRIRDRDRPD